MFPDFTNSFQKKNHFDILIYILSLKFIWDIFQITEKKQQTKKSTIFWRTFDVIIDVSVKGLRFRICSLRILRLDWFKIIFFFYLVGHWPAWSRSTSSLHKPGTGRVPTSGRPMSNQVKILIILNQSNLEILKLQIPSFH